MTFTFDTLIIRSPDLITTDMDGDTVMMSIERGTYFGIGGVGPRVWDLLAQPLNVNQLTDSICAEYKVDPETCRADVFQFVNALLERGLVSFS